MTTLSIGNAQKSLPSNWDECAKHQLLQLIKAKMLQGPYNGNPDSVAESTWLTIIATLLNLTKKEFKKLKLARFQYAQIRNLCTWVFSTENHKKPFETFTHKTVTYILPAEDYANSDDAGAVGTPNHSFRR